MALVDAVPFRPFTKIVNFTAASSTSSVTLTDTAGTPILCNYIQASIIAPVTVNQAAYIHVVPSGISKNPAVSLGNGVSGSFGLIGTVYDPAELYLGGADYCSSLSVYSVSAYPVVISYGVRVEANPLKALQKYPGL